MVKIPRFTFEKFPSADPTLSVSMKSVGEAMSIGRTFKEALQKGLRSLEIKKYGLESVMFAPGDRRVDAAGRELIYQKLRTPCAERIFYVGDAFRAGIGIEKIHQLSKIDRWFLNNIKQIIDLEQDIVQNKENLSDELFGAAKQYGFSDRQIGKLIGKKEEEVSRMRLARNISPSFKLVDTCAAEFRAHTPYFYSTYDR